MTDLGEKVLAVLADAAPDSMQEGEIKDALGRSWSLAPTLRALRRQGLIERDGWWGWKIATPKPTLRLIEGGSHD